MLPVIRGQGNSPGQASGQQEKIFRLGKRKRVTVGVINAGNFSVMFYNYLKVTLRNINKNRVHSLINIAGLAIGLAGCLIIFQFVSFERSFNKFHEHSGNIYRVSYSKEKDGVESFNTVLTYSGVGPLLKQNFPEVVDFARLRPMRIITATSIVTYKDVVFEEDRVYYADPSFLRMFSFKMLEGDPRTALKDQFSAVITESTARKYFGEEEAVGKVLRHGNDLNFTVTGVMEDVPLNSHVKFDFLLSHSTLKAIMPDSWNEYDITRFHGHLYILMAPGADLELFKSKLPQFVEDRVGGLQLKANGTVLKLGVMPLEDIHLYSNIEHEAEVNGDAKTVNFFSIIAILILFIAWVNYINLSTARATERANEVGVRKVMGAYRWQLIRQFLFESAIINMVAVVLATGLVALAQILLEKLGAPPMLMVNIWAEETFWTAIMVLLVAGILFSGFYPAFALAGFQPVDVLKGGSYQTGKGSILRKVLVVFQFSTSVALIIGTAIVYLQINFLRNQDLGVDLDRSIVVQAPLLTDSTYGAQIQSFKSELLNNAAIKSVAASSDIPGREFNSATWYKKANETDDHAQFCYRASIDEDLIPALNIELLAGRNFVSGDNGRSTILNETAVHLFQFTNPGEALGNELVIMGADDAEKLKIVGVIRDYNHQSPKIDYAPLVINYSPSTRNYFVVKFNGSNKPAERIPQTISLIESAYKTSFTGNPLKYFFLDREFEKQYNADQQFGDLIGIFAVLALVVACLGLFGLSSYTVLRRKKEIGIKKILGSSVARILSSLLKDYIILIIIANLVSWPVIYLLMQNWLEEFVRHIPVYWWLFPVAGLAVTILALLTVSFHTIKAATANPVDSLRYE